MNISSGMAAVKAKRRQENFNKSAERTINSLSISSLSKVRVSTRLAKYILINYDTIMVSGKLYSTQVRNIGAGVKELFLKEVE